MQPTRPPMTLILVDSDEEAGAFRSSGFKSVRVVTGEESICAVVNRKSVLDPTLEFFARFVIAVKDQDLRDGLAIRIDDTKCDWIDWASGPQNAVALLEHGGAEALVARVENARPMWGDEVCLASDVPESRAEHVYTTGFDKLDAHGFRLTRPAFMPVIGPYGSGKSILVRQLACNLFRLHGWRTLITAFEEKIKPRYMRDLRRHLIGSAAMGTDAWVPKPESSWTPADVERANKQIDEGFRFFRRKRNTLLDMDRLLDRVEYAVQVYGVDVVIIDPINEIDHQVPRGMTKTDYLGSAIMRMKQLADDYNLLFIVCAHPPKDGVQRRAGPRIYNLNDGADTANYGNKADIGWCVWRPSMAPDCPTFLNIDKTKDHEIMGQPTLAAMALNEMHGRFAITAIGYDAVTKKIGRAHV